jgi:acyl-CoA reductase-like NAD-dependent aldehyde dehydrogenase
LERCDHIRNLGKTLKKNKEQYAKIITEEMGKPLAQSYAEIDKCVWLCEYYTEYAEAFLRDEIRNYS